MQCENNINNTERNYLLLETNLVVAIGKELELLFAQCMRSLRFCCVRILQTYCLHFQVFLSLARCFKHLGASLLWCPTLAYTHTPSSTHTLTHTPTPTCLAEAELAAVSMSFFPIRIYFSHFTFTVNHCQLRVLAKKGEENERCKSETFQ